MQRERSERDQATDNGVPIENARTERPAASWSTAAGRNSHRPATARRAARWPVPLHRRSPAARWRFRRRHRAEPATRPRRCGCAARARRRAESAARARSSAADRSPRMPTRTAAEKRSRACLRRPAARPRCHPTPGRWSAGSLCVLASLRGRNRCSTPTPRSKPSSTT